MKYKIEQYERCETTSAGSIEDHLIGITKPSIDRMLRMDNAGDCIALYTFYCYTRKWQKNNIPRATSEYAMNGLKWGRERFSKAKSNLLELGLIEDVQRKDENGRVLGWYIGVKFAQNATKGDFHIAEIEDNHPTGFPQGGLTRVCENRIQIPYTDSEIPNTNKEMQEESSAKASHSSTVDLNEPRLFPECADARSGKSDDLNSRPPQSEEERVQRGSRKSPPKKREPKIADETYIAKLKQIYPDIDIDTEMRKMDAWLLANPTRKKSQQFVSNWINRAAERVAKNNPPKQTCPDEKEDPEGFNAFWASVKPNE